MCSTPLKLPGYFAKTWQIYKNSSLKTGNSKQAKNQRANLAALCRVSNQLPGEKAVPAPFCKASDSFNLTTTDSKKGMKSRLSEWIWDSGFPLTWRKRNSRSMNYAGLRGSCLAIGTTEGMRQRDQLKCLQHAGVSEPRRRRWQSQWLAKQRKPVCEKTHRNPGLSHEHSYHI